MKDEILLELAKRWETEADTYIHISDNKTEIAQLSLEQGNREAKRECADTLRTLVNIFGIDTASN